MAAVAAVTGSCAIACDATQATASGGCGYRHVLYLLPPAGFTFAGYGELPGRTSWYAGNSYSVRWVWGHELAHNW